MLRPYTAFKLSLRLPPLVDGNEAALKLKALLEDNAPYNAKVTFHPDGRAGALGATGWNAPELAPWLRAGAERGVATRTTARRVGYIGQGGTIPLMSMLQKGFPSAQMMVCGVLGPKSNAHGPERVPARAVRQAAHRGGGAGDCGLPLMRKARRREPAGLLAEA